MKLPMRGTLARSEQGLVERLEPVAERLECVAFADFEDDVLDDVGVGTVSDIRQLGIEIAKGRGFLLRRRSPLEVRSDEIARIIDGKADQLVELRIISRRRARRVALDELPRGLLVANTGQAGEVEEQPVGQRQRRRGTSPPWMW